MRAASGYKTAQVLENLPAKVAPGETAAGMSLVRLDITDRPTARCVLELQQRSYRVEADLIGFHSIPPLYETVDELVVCGERFLGAMLESALVGAISWRVDGLTLDINRLVVDPAHFRRGVATTLLRAVLATEPAAERAIVQTGANNVPAIALYLREGFEAIDEIDVGDGLRVLRFARRIN